MTDKEFRDAVYEKYNKYKGINKNIRGIKWQTDYFRT